jgi:hypothetical protein
MIQSSGHSSVGADQSSMRLVTSRTGTQMSSVCVSKTNPRQSGPGVPGMPLLPPSLMPTEPGEDRCVVDLSLSGDGICLVDSETATSANAAVVD